jgi:hypothetical protein
MRGQSMQRISGGQTMRLATLVLAVCAHEPAWGDDTWVDRRDAGPFSVQANFALEPHVGLFDELTQLQLDLVRTLGIPPTHEPVELFLFSNSTSYRDYLERVFPAVPHRRALFIKGSGPGMIFAHLNREFDVDLRHESTHALLHGSQTRVPLWLDEGLAEYFELPPLRRARNNAHLTAIRWSLRLGVVPRLKTLERKHDLREMSAADYRYAWAWVHFMLHGPPEALDELVAYLAEIRREPAPQPLSDRLERRLPHVERRLVRHFSQWR